MNRHRCPLPARRPALAGAVLAAALMVGNLPGVPVLAEERVALGGALELGIAGTWLSDDDARFGRYTGAADRPAHLLGRLSLSANRDHRYLDLSAADLGLDARRLRLEAGAAGRLALVLQHESLPNLIHRNALTPYRGVGGADLALPAGLTPGATSADIDGLADSLQPLTLRTDRRRNGILASLALDAHWQTRLAFEHERKQGLQHYGGVTGQNPRFAASVLLPQPVDYETGRLDGSLHYHRHRLQFEAGYQLSTFSNAHRALRWDVPFVQASDQAFAHPAIARGGLDPDNRHQRVRLSAGVGDLPLGGRLSAVIEAGRMEQDEPLLPFSTDTLDGTAIITENGADLPRSTAEARIDTRHAALNLSARPLPRLAVTLGWRWLDVDNRTPYTLFDRVINDTGPQSLSEDLYSRPYSWRRTEGELNARYRFAGGLGLRTQLRHQRHHRDEHSPVARIVEDSLGISADRRIGQLTHWRASWRIAYRHAVREADAYNAFRSYSTLYDAVNCPDNDSAADPCFSNHPDLRMLHVADRTRDHLHARLQLAPSADTDIGIALTATRDRYRDTPRFSDTRLGLIDDDSIALTVDAGRVIGERWGINGYYTREHIEAIQNGRAFNGAIDTATDPARNWRAEFDNVIDTVGITVRLDSFDHRHRLLLGYTLALESGDIAFTTGPALTATNMPRNRVRRQVIELRGTRELRQQVQLHVGVEHEMFDSRDRARDSLEAGGTQLDSVLPIAGALPDYRALMVWTALGIRW